MEVADGRASVSVRADGIQYLQWVQGTTVDGRDAHDVLEESMRLSGGEKYAILVNMTGIAHQTQDAREAFNADARVIAAALLGTGPMDEILAGGSTRAVHPTAFFTSEDDAVAWLAERVRQSSGTDRGA